MDWVKPKHRAKQLSQRESSEPEISASSWLKQLYQQNIAALQSEIPVRESRTKIVRGDVQPEDYLRSILWGTSNWEIETAAHREYLCDLVDAFGQPVRSLKGIKSKNKSRSENESANAHRNSVANQVGKWISQQLPKAGHNPYVALACAGWFHALPLVGREVAPSLWVDVLQCALTQVDRAWQSEPADGLYPWMIWSCEIPLALAKQLSHLGGKDRIVSETLNRIALILEQSLDDPRDFLVRGGHDLRAMMACIIRCRWSADTLGARKWFPPQRKAIGKLAIATLALSDAYGGSLLFDSDDNNSNLEQDFWAALHDAAGVNKKLSHAMACALPDPVGSAIGEKPARLRKDKTLDVSLPKHSHYWEKNSIACMRRSWQDSGSRVAIDFSSDVIWIDVLGQGGQRILSGDWDVQISRNHQPLDVNVQWQEVCWFTDDDVDYLELESEVEDVCKIQRQIMLVRNEGLVYFADALIASDDDLWTIESTWSCADSIHFAAESKSTEGKLVSTKKQQPVALVLPLAMPEWRQQTCHSVLSNRDSTLFLKREAKANRIYSPLVLSMRNVEQTKAYTWRQLTIAEELQIQPRNVAEAYRVQINKDQWVFYRSLSPCARRTVMGLHLNTEFYAGRFSADDGEYEPIIEVNPE